MSSPFEGGKIPLPHHWKHPPSWALERVMEMGREGVEDVGKEMTDPDDDWHSIMLCQSKSGDGIIVAMDPDFFASPAGKDRLADEVLPKIIRSQGVVAFALVMSTWFLSTDEIARVRGVSLDEAGEEVKAYQAAGGLPSGHPLRMEMVLVQGMTSQRAVLDQAIIDRHQGAPPTLRPWQRLTVGEDGFTYTGRFVESLRQALAPQG